MLFLCARCVLCGEYKVLFFFLRLSGERSRLTPAALRISNFILMKIAFLGMGIMGRPMAANLVKAGHDVTIWNRTAPAELPGAKIGGGEKQ